jgi:SnoaL-like domain
MADRMARNIQITIDGGRGPRTAPGRVRFVTSSDIRDVIHDYYAAWASQDKNAAAALMADDMRHASVWGVWESKESYLEEFENLSAGLTDIEFVREVYDGDQAFLLFRVVTESGAWFTGTDLVTVSGGLVSEIVNVNAGDPNGLNHLVG